MPRSAEITETAVIFRLAESRIIALAAPAYPERIRTVAEGLARDGVSGLELCHAHLDSIRAARRVDGLLVGVGNVQSYSAAETATRGGAQFATAPAIDLAVVRACRELELPCFPSAATPSEIGRLAAAGVRTVRLFPVAFLGGPAFVEAVASVYPEIRFIPSGAIGPKSLHGYLGIASVSAVASTEGVVRTAGLSS
jgi:2-dehydro-3-deoxyphosphogluconate aldolase/(4S)-4-hydroxy-2-oxoglutarate aldolase